MTGSGGWVVDAPRLRPVMSPIFLLQAAGLALAYWAVARAGLALGSLPGNIAPIWPPTGVALAGLVLCGRRYWPGVAAGAFLANATTGGLPLLVVLGMAAGNTAEALAGESLLRRAGFRSGLDRGRDVAVLLVAGAVLPTAVSATVGTASLALGGVSEWPAYWVNWRVWWVGDALGALVVAPVIFTLAGAWSSRHARRPQHGRFGLPLGAALLGLTPLVAYLVFSQSAPRVYLILPFVVCAAIRFSPSLTATATLSASIVAVVRTAAGHGPFAAGGNDTHSLWVLDSFLAVMAVTGLVLAALVQERDRAATELKSSNRDLEDRISERTKALRADRERLAEAQRLARIGSWEWDVAANTVTWSDELYRIYGVPADEPMSYERYLACVHPEDRATVAASVQQAVETGQPFSHEHRTISADGTLRWLRGQGQVEVGPDGRPIRMRGTCQDITEVRGVAEQFRDLLETAPDGMVIVDGDGVIVRVNRQLERLFGWDRQELVGQPVETLMPERMRSRHTGHRRGFTLDPRVRPMGASLELFALRADGSEFPVEISLSPLTTDTGVLVSAAIRDISDRRRAAELLSYQALHDTLTGLPNRALLADRLEHALGLSGRAGTSVAAVFVDIDRFKLVNDSRGHAAGDELLTVAAQRLGTAVRGSDTVARFGGDEFVVVCEGPLAAVEATRVAERIADAFRPAFVVNGEEVYVSVSLGIAVAGEGASPESLLRDADAAMYRAKERGRSRCEHFDDTMRIEAAERLETQSALHRALERGELRVFYQPVVDLQARRVAGVEALVRWQHPELGLVGPAAFVPLAEETGLIGPIGTWVLEEAARQWAVWQRQTPDRSLGLSVNMSARQLRQPNLLSIVHDVLERHGLEPGRLCLELTESAVMEEVPLHAELLDALHGLGVQLAVDDFGTGYSSLAYLKRLPVDVLKVDQSFVGGLGRDRADTAIVESVVALAHALGLRVVAEGVETHRQMLELAALGCDLAQGYYFARPLEPDRLAGLLTSADAGWAGVRPAQMTSASTTSASASSSFPDAGSL